MKGTRHSEEQMIAILKQGEAGLSTAELCRQHNITEQTYDRWKAEYGSMESGGGKKLKIGGPTPHPVERPCDQPGRQPGHCQENCGLGMKKVFMQPARSVIET
ncbi:MAG: transposase [Acidobacteria bacterium]|nr:transposase [Acidobacteriota bacterium]